MARGFKFPVESLWRLNSGHRDRGSARARPGAGARRLGEGPARPGTRTGPPVAAGGRVRPLSDDHCRVMIPDPAAAAAPASGSGCAAAVTITVTHWQAQPDGDSSRRDRHRGGGAWSPAQPDSEPEPPPEPTVRAARAWQAGTHVTVSDSESARRPGPAGTRVPASHESRVRAGPGSIPGQGLSVSATVTATDSESRVTVPRTQPWRQPGARAAGPQAQPQAGRRLHTTVLTVTVARAAAAR